MRKPQPVTTDDPATLPPLPGWIVTASVEALEGVACRSGATYAPAVRAAADVGRQALNLDDFDLAVLAAIAYHQPISRNGLKGIFGREISRELIGRLAERNLIGTGPREPRRGAPYTLVTTETFLATFGMESLPDLPDPGQLADAGLSDP